MLRLLIFDLDGTLADTAIDITNAVNFALQPFGVRPFSVEEIKGRVGSGITSLLHSLIPPEYSPDLAIDEAIERFLGYYSEHILDNTTAYPNVKETLQQLDAYKKAVISNKRELFSKKVLEGIGILQYFDIVLGSDSVPERKPSPVPVFEVLKRLGIRKDEAIMIGDSNYDIETARAAGIRVIAVTYGFRPREVLKDADYMIEDFGELANLLSHINHTT
jgi:phosphoglycolate phosphatase